MTLKWMAYRLKMGTWIHVANRFYHLKKRTCVNTQNPFMSEIKFSKNFSDHSVHSGTDAGFQFEFYCERCNDAWRSEFSPFRGGQASSWLGRAAGVFGGVLGEASSAAE